MIVYPSRIPNSILGQLRRYPQRYTVGPTPRPHPAHTHTLPGKGERVVMEETEERKRQREWEARETPTQ